MSRWRGAGGGGMLDFRFLVGTILVGIALAMTALRMFGPIEPLLADRPDLETAVPRPQLAPVAKLPNAPASKQSPNAAPPIAAVPIIPKPPASIKNIPVLPPSQTPQIASTPRVPVPVIPAPPPSTAAAPMPDIAAVPLPTPKPDIPEITGSIDPAGYASDLAAIKPRRAPAAVRKRESPEVGEINLFRLLFPQAAGQKQQGTARQPAAPRPFTQQSRTLDGAAAR